MVPKAPKNIFVEDGGNINLDGRYALYLHINRNKGKNNENHNWLREQNQ